MKTVVIGISSGIAAYKMLDVVKTLKRQAVNVIVVMTRSAVRMVATDEFEKASGNKVYTVLFEKGFDYKTILTSHTVEHIALADRADVVVIAPATANIIAKMAHGIADDFLTTMLLAVTCPVILCPSMNVHMWHHPATKRNISMLTSFGYHMVGPEAGSLACGYEGMGRLASVETLNGNITRFLSITDSLHEKKILVTAGGTIEPIDSVRSITNRSSGKMGIALAEACYFRGANVTLLISTNAAPRRVSIPEESFTTSEDLHTLMKKHIPHADIVFHCAAVSDFIVAKPFAGKLSSNKPISLSLQPAGKLIVLIKKWNPNIRLVAFKAAYALSRSELAAVARKKLEVSHADAIVANDIGQTDRGFESDTNEVVIVLKSGEKYTIPLAPKKIVAEKIVDYLIKKAIW